MNQAELVSAITAAPERLLVDWVTLPGTPFEVTAQPVRIDGADGPIIAVSAHTAQRCADMLSAYPTTPEIEDAIWTYATVRLEPHLLPVGDSESIARWQTWADATLAQHRVGPQTLVSVGDKSWVLRDSCSPDRVANYGFHVPASECSMGGTWHGIATYTTASSTRARVVQPLANAHNRYHVDYSQHCRLWRIPAKVDLAEVERFHGRQLRSWRLTGC